jgi:hypothetical protein
MQLLLRLMALLVLVLILETSTILYLPLHQNPESGIYNQLGGDYGQVERRPNANYMTLQMTYHGKLKRTIRYST